VQRLLGGRGIASGLVQPMPAQSPPCSAVCSSMSPTCISLPPSPSPERRRSPSFQPPSRCRHQQRPSSPSTEALLGEEERVAPSPLEAPTPSVTLRVVLFITCLFGAVYVYAGGPTWVIASPDAPPGAAAARPGTSSIAAAPTLVTPSERHKRLATAGGVASVAVAVEAAIDEDGDLKVWRREFSIRLGTPAARDESGRLHPGARAVGSFWHEAGVEGCGGELLHRSVGILQGRLLCSRSLPPKVRSHWQRGATPNLKRGSVGWLQDGDDRAAFFITLKAGLLPRHLGQATIFGEVETASWPAVEDLMTQVPIGGGGRFEPPLRISLAAE
jgi:hypothetical protein